jgi:hypothetical protein
MIKMSSGDSASDFLPNLSAPVTNQPQQFLKLATPPLMIVRNGGAADPAETGADDPAGAAVGHPTDRTVTTIAMTAGMEAVTGPPVTMTKKATWM